MIYLANIDLSGNQLMNAIIQPLATAPSNPKLGQIYTNSSTSKIMWYTGATWQTVGVVVESSATNGNIKVDGVEMKVFQLPIASASILGGVKVGTGLSIDANGVLTVSEAGSVDWSNVLNKPTDLVEDANYVHTDNNYTTTEKTKLAGIATGAEVNVNADWNATSGDAQILNKPVALSAFTNDSGFITSSVTNLTNYYLKTELYTQSQVNDLINAISTLNIEVVTSLPTENISTTTIYLVAKTPTATEDGYDEYIWVSSKVGTDKWEMIGNTVIDLSNYLQKTGDASNTTVAFTAASSRNLPVTGESLATVAGKIVKYLTDLKTVAFTGSYNDLIDKPNTILVTTNSLTTATATYSITGTVIDLLAKDSSTNEVVMIDYIITQSEGSASVVVTVSSVPTNPITIIITSKV